MKKLILKNCISALVAVAFLFGAWVVAWAAIGNELLVPAPWDCLNVLGGLIKTREFWSAFWATLSRTLTAFGISFVFAAVFALVAYTVPTFARIFSPIVTALRALPVLAVLLILWLILGAGDAPIAVAFLSLFPMLYVAVLAALSGVDEDLIVMSRVYNVPLKKRIVSLYLPSAAPYVLKESGAALAFSLKLVVSAEVVARTAKSLGGMMSDAKADVWGVPTLFALVVAAFLTAVVLETLTALIARAVERRVK
ncbi:MAG: ABC transporter permease subunit [Clostridia bacterium]|nr:ABC transporter permease subunit [Clostridia bacterium]